MTTTDTRAWDPIVRNPKQAGTILFDCIPQEGKCANGCNQCFFNRPDAFYVKTPYMPDPGALPQGAIMRVNSGHDSNIDTDHVIDSTACYPRRFFNTSIPRIGHFPGPVVLTANPREEEEAYVPADLDAGVERLMFVRLRVSGTNLAKIWQAIEVWTDRNVPVVLTFMAYYHPARPSVGFSAADRFMTDIDGLPADSVHGLTAAQCYTWKRRTLNAYWCPTPAFMAAVMGSIDNPLVSLCGAIDGCECHQCRNCETYYYQATRRLSSTWNIPDDPQGDR
jgi:hypothetical protein